MQGMEEVAIGNLEPGAVLAEAVLDGEGRVLLGPGAVLTPILIQRLEKWRVSKVRVTVPAGASNAPAKAAAPTAGAEDLAAAATSSAPSPKAAAADGEPDPLAVWDGLFSKISDSAETRRIHQALVYWYEANAPVAVE